MKSSADTLEAAQAVELNKTSKTLTQTLRSLRLRQCYGISLTEEDMKKAQWVW